jgi:hypothetical protein
MIRIIPLYSASNSSFITLCKTKLYSVNKSKDPCGRLTLCVHKCFEVFTEMIHSAVPITVHENGGGKFRRNVGIRLQNFTVSQPKRPQPYLCIHLKEVYQIMINSLRRM